MFSNWVEEYRILSQKTRFISQLSTFLITLFSLLSLYDIAGFFNENPRFLREFLETAGLLPAITFQSLILFVFALRFALLFFKTKKAFWSNQILWLIGLMLLTSYWFVSRPPENSFGLYSTYEEIFRHASRSFDFLGMCFLILSPLRQFLTLAIAIIKSSKLFRRDAV